MLRAVLVRSLVLLSVLAVAMLTGGGAAAADNPGGGNSGVIDVTLPDDELRRPEPLPARDEAVAARHPSRKALLTPEPVFIVAGLRVWASGLWRPVPAELPTGVPVEFAAEVRNVGTTGGTAVLTAAAEVWSLDESLAVHVMSGAATVVLAPGAAHFLELEPAWLPLSAGSYRILGAVAESGVEIGDFSETVQVIDGAADCPVPGVNLP